MNLSTIAIIFALCLTASSVITTFNHTWLNEPSPNYLYALAQPSSDDGAKPYVNCTELDETHRRCEIFLGKFVQDRIVMDKICVSDFHVAGFLSRIEAVAVAYDKVAVAYSYYYTSRFVEFEAHHRYRIVDAVSCQAVDAKETFNFTTLAERRYFRDFGSVLLYENGSFDLFKSNYHDLCDGALCRYSFNALGYKVDGGVSYLPDSYEGTDRLIRPLGKVSRDRYIMIDDYFAFWGRCVKVVMASGSSEDRQLLKLTLGYSAAKDAQFYHGFTTVCWTDEFEVGRKSTIYCQQFDSSGEKILDLRVVAEGRVDLLKVQSLAVGGFLLLNNVCGKLRVCKDFQFRYVQNDGYGYQPIKITDIGCKYAFAHQRRMKIWFAEFGSNCVASVCEPGSVNVENLTMMAGACYPNQYLWSSV